MSSAPFYYDIVNQKIGPMRPGTIHARNTGLSQDLERQLIQRAMSPFKFTFPSEWDRDFVLYTLYLDGYFTVFKTDKYGVIPMDCALTGKNIFYQPSSTLVNNPALSPEENRERTIGTECTLVKLQPDYFGIGTVVANYADLMAATLEAFGMNILNSKLSYILFAKNKALAESLKSMVDRVQEGQPAVVVDRNLFDKPNGSPLWDSFAQDLKANFIAPDLLDLVRDLLNQFDEAVGLPNANTGKKERLITDEVNVNNFSTRSKCELWFDNVNSGLEKTRVLFNIPESELNVKWREGARGVVDFNSDTTEL